jgi:hypothetical protein
MQSGSRGVEQNLFCNFWTLLQVSMNFGSLHYFMELKTIENDLKSAAQWWAEIGPWLHRAARQHAARGRPKGHLGHGLAARSSCGGGLRAAAWSPRVSRAQDGRLARLPAAW